MKQTTFAQRLAAALVALCMVLSVCAPALAADRKPILFQKNSGLPTPVTSDNIGKLLPGCSYAYDGTTVTITMAASQGEVMQGVTLVGGPSTDIVLVCTNNTRMDGGPGLTITSMRNVTIKTADTSQDYTGAFYGALKVTNCYGNVTVTNPHGAAVVYSLDVDNTAGTGNVTITGSRADGPICAVGNFGSKVNIASNGDVKIENIVVSEMFGAQLRYQAVDGELTVTSSKSVTTTGGASKVDITSKGAVEIKSDDTKNVVGNGLSVNAGGAVTVTGGGTGDDAAAIKGNATITAGRNVSIQNEIGIAVDGNLTIDSSTGVTVVGNTPRNAVRYAANITSSGAVNISNSRGIAVGGKLTVKNASGTGDVTVTGTGNATLNNGADITSRGAVSITNTGSGLAVDGKLTVYNSGSVKVSGGNASAPAVSGDITLTSSGKMELSNPNGQVTSKKLTVKNSTGDVSVTGSKSGSAMVASGTDINTTGSVNITNTSGPAIFGGLNVEQSGGITVTGSRASEPIITGSSTIKNTNKVEIINNGTNGQTAESITYTPPAGNGYFYRTAQNGTKLHTRKAISGTTPYLCIEPDTLYTLTLSGGVTATTGGTKDTKFYAGESVTVTAPQDTETKTFKEWTGGENIISTNPTDWRTKGTFTFTMPAGNVKLDASYNTITKYNVNVTGGTIGGEPGKTTGSYLPGTKVTVVFTGSTGIEDQFEKWTGGENITKTDPANWQSKPSFSFTMPAGNVTLEAECKTVYNVSVDDSRGTVLVNNEKRSRALEGETVKVKTSDTFFDAYHQFNGWSLSGDSAKLMNPSANWENSETFTFTMPAGNVSLKADYKQLYDLTVTGGTVVDENGDTSGIYLPGTKVTVTFTGNTSIKDQFRQWTGGENITDATPTNWQTSETFTFTMPADNVTLSAEYRKTYQIHEPAGKAKFFAEGAEEQEIDEALPGTRIIAKVPDSELNDHRQFNMWGLASEKELVEPDQNWQGKQSFRFTMPEGNVELRAFFTTLYDVTVTGGTIEGGTDDNGIYKKIVKPGELVTVRAESTEENPFQQWTCTGTAPAAPDDGWTVENWETSREFTFKMPSGNVTLEAQHDQLYKVSIHDNLGNVTINGKPLESLWVKDGETVTVATTLKDGYSMEFKEWNSTGTAPEEPVGGWTETNKSTSTTFTFKMPKGTVDLTASWMSGAIEKPDPEDPNTEPLDPGFTVDPEPAAKTDTAGAALVAAAVGGAAVWGGYEVATRVLLHKLLPEGAAIPKTRAELALLLWNAAGQPEPAAVPAFADVADPETAKAAQWCTEQGCLTVKEPDRFQPDKHVTKYRVIDCWNKAFPAA